MEMDSGDGDRDVEGRITELWVYPVKSCAGISVQRSVLGQAGLQWDRHWMVVDRNGVFLSQRSHPRMAWIGTAIDAHTLTLTYPGLEPLAIGLEQHGPVRMVQVWKDTVVAWDMGPQAAQWLSAALGGEACSLVRCDPQQPRQASERWTQGAAAPVYFADGFPLLVLSQAAVDGLNQRLAAAGEARVGVERFRANIVWGQVDAHDEDRVQALDVVGSQAIGLHMVKPCTRCPIPDIDPVTAERGTAVGHAMRSYRQDARVGGAISFGMNALVQGLSSPACGTVTLAVGDVLAGDWQFA